VDELRAQLRRYSVGIWRHRWIAVAIAWLICIVGWAGVSTIPNSYEASARLYVDADQILTPLLRGLALDNSLGNQIEVLQRTLLSRPNLEKLISKTDLELTIRGPADLERLVADLENSIHIVPQTKNLFTITYRNQTPQLAHDVVNTILNIFIESKIGNSRSDMENARVFLDQQIASYERKLREAEAKRAEFRTKYIDLLPGDGGVSRLDAARVQVRALEGQLADAVGRLDRLTQELAVTPQTLTTEVDPGGAAGGGGGSELAAAERHLQELLGTETENHPDVTRQRRLIEQLRRSGGGGSGVSTPARPARSVVQPNAIYDQLKVLKIQADSDVASLKRQVADATIERDRLEEIARSAPGVQAQYMNLDRDYDVVRKNYDELLARREEMRLSAAANADADKVKLQIIDPPVVPQVPVGPKRTLLISGVLLAGLGGGMASAVLLGQLDRSFHDLRQLRAFGLPVAGGVSLLPGASGKRRGVAHAAAVAVAVLLLCGVYGGLLYQVLYGGLLSLVLHGGLA
jgi:polysaccharide chain length determinant protein (PEP-CTERM system associated)